MPAPVNSRLAAANSATDFAAAHPTLSAAHTGRESTTIQRRTAVSEITPEQAHLFVHSLLLGSMKNESRTTSSVLAAVPAVQLEYRPEPCARTANDLLRHVASADNWFLKSVVDRVFAPGSAKIP